MPRNKNRKIILVLGMHRRNFKGWGILNSLGVKMGEKLIRADWTNPLGHFEDVELDFRARKFGWKARFVPESIVYHKRGATSIQNPQLFNELLMRNILLVVERWYSVWDKIFFTLFWSVKILINTIEVIFKLDTIKNIAQRRKIVRDKLRYILMIWSKKFRSKFKGFQKTNK